MRYLCFFTLLFSTFIGLSQEFAPLGATWYYGISTNYSGNPNMFLETYYKIESSKDTIINGQACRKVGNDFIYENNGEIFFYAANAFHKVYDFNVTVGDTTQLTFKSPVNSNPILNVLFITDSLSKIPTEVVADSLLAIHGHLITDSTIQILDICWDCKITYIERIGSYEQVVMTIGGATVPEYIPPYIRCYNDSTTNYKPSNLACDFDNVGLENKKIVDLIQLFPNPNNGTFTITSRESGTIVIFDLLGKIILQKRIASGSNRIDLSTVNNGTYTLKVEMENKFSIQKLIIQH